MSRNDMSDSEDEAIRHAMLFTLQLSNKEYNRLGVLAAQVFEEALEQDGFTVAAVPAHTPGALDERQKVALDVLDVLEDAMAAGDKGDTWPGLIDSIRFGIKDRGIDAVLIEAASPSETTT